MVGQEAGFVERLVRQVKGDCIKEGCDILYMSDILRLINVEFYRWL